MDKAHTADGWSAVYRSSRSSYGIGKPAGYSFRTVRFAYPELPVVLYVALVFILGGFIGLLAGSSLLARANIRIKAIEKDLAKARKERDSLLARLSSSSDGGLTMA